MNILFTKMTHEGIGEDPHKFLLLQVVRMCVRSFDCGTANIFIEWANDSCSLQVLCIIGNEEIWERWEAEKQDEKDYQISLAHADTMEGL